MFNFFGKKEEDIKKEKQPEIESEKQGLVSWGFDMLKQAVSKTTETLVDSVVDAVEEEAEFSEFVLDDMEDLLIRADLGVNGQ